MMSGGTGATTTVGVVGLGAMGAPAARHLCNAGFRVWGFDIDEKRRQLVGGVGAQLAGSVRALSSCDVVLVFVPNDDDVHGVAKEWVAAKPAPGSLFVICSSVRPETCAEVQRLCRPLGARVVDAALTGGVRAAEAGSINLLVGGARDDVDRARPVFNAFCSAVHHLGELGAGQVGKTINNLLHWGTIVLLVEALELGERLGVPAQTMQPALQAGPTDSRTLRDLDQFRLTWWVKDFDNARRMADGVDMELPVANLTKELMSTIDLKRLKSLAARR